MRSNYIESHGVRIETYIARPGSKHTAPEERKLDTKKNTVLHELQAYGIRVIHWQRISIVAQFLNPSVIRANETILALSVDEIVGLIRQTLWED